MPILCQFYAKRPLRNCNMGFTLPLPFKTLLKKLVNRPGKASLSKLVSKAGEWFC